MLDEGKGGALLPSPLPRGGMGRKDQLFWLGTVALKRILPREHSPPPSLPTLPRNGEGISLSWRGNNERHWGIGREALRQHYRSRARPAAAVRGRKGLVQVDMHG